MDIYANGYSVGVYINHEDVSDNYSIAAFSTRLATRVEMYVQAVHVRVILKPHSLLLPLRA